LVVVTGDHGESLGDHGEQSHGLFAYESTLRGPADHRRDWRRTHAVSGFSGTVREASSVSARHVDILPTILDAIGQSSTADLPGRTLLRVADRGRLAPRPSYFEAMSATLNRG